MMHTFVKGAVDQSVILRIVDSTDGTPETGVVAATGGLALFYTREQALRVALTAASDLAALDTAHADGGMKHIGNGYYRIDVQDAAFATGKNYVIVEGTVTGMVVVGAFVQLVGYNPQDAVRLGLTALPNAAANAAGGLPISAAGGLNLDAQIGTNIDAILVDTGTTLDGRLPAALTADGNIKADALRINGNSTAAVNFALTASRMVAGTVDHTAGAATTTEFEADDITTAAADHYNGRIIIFTSGTLQFQATSITDYSLVGGRGHFTVPALTSAPADNVTFIVV